MNLFKSVVEGGVTFFDSSTMAVEVLKQERESWSLAEVLKPLMAVLVKSIMHFLNKMGHLLVTHVISILLPIHPVSHFDEGFDVSLRVGWIEKSTQMEEDIHLR